MGSIDYQTARLLFAAHRNNRVGINQLPALGSVCLICGSPHVDPDPKDPRRFICRNCGFGFARYECPACGAFIDSRDPTNPKCPDCRLCKCTCGVCACAP